MSNPTLRTIQVGSVRQHGNSLSSDPLQRPWTTGFFKDSVVGPVWAGVLNLAGDQQADLINHGGEDKAVCVYPTDHYPYWQSVLSPLDLPFGAFGENFTIDGLSEKMVSVGDIWQIGEATFEISQPRQPCWKVARRWGIKTLAYQILQTGKTGWYFRVLQEGNVSAGAACNLVSRPHPEWTVEEANRIMHHDEHDISAAFELSRVPALSTSWRDSLVRRVEENT